MVRPLKPIPATMPPARIAFVQALREKRGPGTIQAAAEKCHLSWSGMSRYFAGEVFPDQEMAQIMGAVCGIPWPVLMPLWHAAHIEAQLVTVIHPEAAIRLILFQMEVMSTRMRQLEEVIERLTTTREDT